MRNTIGLLFGLTLFVAACSPPAPPSRVELALVSPAASQAFVVRGVYAQIDGRWTTLARDSIALGAAQEIFARVRPPAGHVTALRLELASLGSDRTRLIETLADLWLPRCAAGVITLQLDGIGTLLRGDKGAALRLAQASAKPGICEDGQPADDSEGTGLVIVSDLGAPKDIADPACDTVVCPPGESCRAGLCVPTDPCATVVCPGGQVCIDGVCGSPPDLAQPLDLSTPPDLSSCGGHTSCSGGGNAHCSN